VTRQERPGVTGPDAERVVKHASNNEVSITRRGGNVSTFFNLSDEQVLERLPKTKQKAIVRRNDRVVGEVWKDWKNRWRWYFEPQEDE